MAKNQRTYDSVYKAQAVKLAQEIGGHKASAKLGISKGTLYALSLNDELIELRKRVKEQD